jgi:hypothetical protein
MSTRSNGGIIGPQNRTTTAYANGVWHIYDAQQAVYARNWPGFVPVAPSAPAVGTVTLGSGTQAQYLTATIPFTAGYNGGNAITKVTAISIPGGITANTNGSSPITISGLTANTNYTFGVYETNYFGDSPYGYSNPVTTATVPAAPTIGTATLVGSNVNVAYTTNSNGGAPITSVTAISNPGNITATGNSSPILVTGLGGNTTYTFQVYATNVMGNSSYSSASNSVTTPLVITADYLVVAGGGGGSGARGGGGGAGGLLSGTSISLNSGTTYSVTVGSGGGGGAGGPTYADGSDGANSVFSIYTAVGGGGGGAYLTATGRPGGSGGGGAAGHAGGAGTSGQGNTGGTGLVGGGYGAGGGGGAGATGQNGSSSKGGDGGVGLTTTIITTTVATSRSVGQVSGGNVYFAGGGGGGSFGSAVGAGGLGGGAYGNYVDVVPPNATPYTGGGGGGGGDVSSNGAAGSNGGSGCVIIALSQAATSTTGSPTLDVISGKYVYIFKGNGSITP